MTSGKRSKELRRNPQHQPTNPDAPIPSANQSYLEIQEFQHTSGPLPPPEVLAGYRHVQPDYPERIIVMAEKEQDKRHELTSRLIQSQSDSMRRGQWGLIALGLAGIASGTFLVYNGANYGALIGVAGFLTPVVGAIWGIRQQPHPPQKPHHKPPNQD